MKKILLLASAIALSLCSQSIAAPPVSMGVSECSPLNNGDCQTVTNGAALITGSITSFPSGSTPVVASCSTTNAICTATMPAVAAKTNYLGGFECTTGGATVGVLLAITLTGTISGTTLTYMIASPTGVGSAVAEQAQFVPPLPGLAVNTAIVVNLPAAGAGNVQEACVIHGYVL